MIIKLLGLHKLVEPTCYLAGQADITDYHYEDRKRIGDKKPVLSNLGYVVKELETSENISDRDFSPDFCN